MRAILVALIIGFTLVPAMSSQSQGPGQLFLCENDSRSWTLYESAQPRMFQQEISVQGPGIFTMTMHAEGFGFEGFSYTRNSAWDKWKYVAKTNKGKGNWQQMWRLLGGEQQTSLLQLIKDSNACRGCTITMKMTATNCQKNLAYNAVDPDN